MGSPSDAEATSFAEQLNYLFATRLSPTGRPYTLREVSEATGGKLSIGYLSLVRKGGVAMPSAGRVQALADFFGVDIGYFTGGQHLPEQAQTEMDDALRQALSRPGVRELALRAGQMDDEERALLFEMMDSAEQIARRVRAVAAKQA